MKRKEYCAIIGDINNSRSLRNRASIQLRFHNAIRIINSEFKNEIAARFMVTLGDEFQGLLASPAVSYRLVQRFAELMDPVSFSFGIGIGSISTSFHKMSVSMDGVVFHRARRALDRSKEQGLFLTYEWSHQMTPLLNAVINLLYKQQKKLTSRQRTISVLMREHNNQSIVARALKISQPAVWKSVTSSHFKEVHNSEVALNAFLDSFRRK